MMKKRLFRSLLPFLALLIVASCGQDALPKAYKGYEKISSSIYYKFLEKAAERTLPQEGDVCVFHSTVKNGEMVISSTYDMGELAERIVSATPDGNPVQEILPKMAVGDSVSVVILVDSLSVIPQNFKSGDWMNLLIKMVDIKTLAERQAEKQQYLADLTLNPKGFFWKKETAGNGQKVAIGDEVTFSFSLKKGEQVRYQTTAGQKDVIVLPTDANMLSPMHMVMLEMVVGDKVTAAFEVDRLNEEMQLAVASDGFFKGDLMMMDVEVFALRDSATVGKAQRKLEKEAAQKIAQAKAKSALIDKKMEANIQDYKDKKLNLTKLDSGLKYIIHKKGNGKTPMVGEEVTFHYAGFLSNTIRKFDSSYDKGQPLTIAVGEGNLIQGMDEALLRLPAGTEATIFIPFELGYGAAGNGKNIPEYANLAFYIETVL